jgi:hypothetical protein
MDDDEDKRNGLMRDELEAGDLWQEWDGYEGTRNMTDTIRRHDIPHEARRRSYRMWP